MPKAIDKPLSPMIALVGDDTYLQIENLKQIQEKLGHDIQRFDVDGDDAKQADVIDQLREYSMFGAGKVVVVRSADKFVSSYRDVLEDYLASPAVGATLVLRVSSFPSNTRIYKQIDKLGGVIKCEPPSGAMLGKWITDRAKLVHRVKVEADAAKLLADQIGSDLGKLDNAIAKLALSVDSETVTAGDVQNGVAFEREQEMFQLTNDLTAGRFGEALRRWRQLDQTDPAAQFKAATWITIWLERAQRALALSKTGMPPMTIGRELKIWPANAVTDLLATANQLGPARLDAAVALLTDLDRRAKSGVGEMGGNVERFIVSLL